MRPYHPDDFQPGKRYFLEDRGPTAYTFQALTLLCDEKRTLCLVFELQMPDRFPGEWCTRYIPATVNLRAEEVR